MKAGHQVDLAMYGDIVRITGLAIKSVDVLAD